MTLPQYTNIIGAVLTIQYWLFELIFPSFTNKFRNLLESLYFIGISLWGISMITIFLLDGIDILTALLSVWIAGAIVYNVYRPLYKKYKRYKSPKKFYVYKVNLGYVPAHKLTNNETNYSIIVYRTDDLENWDGKMFRKTYETNGRNFRNMLAVLNQTCKKGAKILFYSYREDFDITYDVEY